MNGYRESKTAHLFYGGLACLLLGGGSAIIFTLINCILKG